MYLKQPSIDDSDVVVVFCRALLELLKARLKIDLFALVLKHLTVDCALLVFLEPEQSAPDRLEFTTAESVRKRGEESRARI